MKTSPLIALVTGANRGIGHAVATGMVAKGITVIATSRKPETGQSAIERISAADRVIYHQLDVTISQDIQGIATFIEETFGKLDILINNAGINYDTWQNVLNADLEEVRQTFDTNTFAPWALIQALYPLLRKSDSPRIVNVSSGSGAFDSQTGGTPGYSLSKLALNGLTRQIAQQVRSDGILVNAVCPGWVRTDMGGSGAPRSPEQGADTIIWAATLPDHGPTGKFFRDRKEISF